MVFVEAPTKNQIDQPHQDDHSALREILSPEFTAGLFAVAEQLREDLPKTTETAEELQQVLRQK